MGLWAVSQGFVCTMVSLRQKLCKTCMQKNTHKYYKNIENIQIAIGDHFQLFNHRMRGRIKSHLQFIIVKRVNASSVYRLRNRLESTIKQCFKTQLYPRSNSTSTHLLILDNFCEVLSAQQNDVDAETPLQRNAELFRFARKPHVLIM